MGRPQWSLFSAMCHNKPCQYHDSRCSKIDDLPLCIKAPTFEPLYLLVHATFQGGDLLHQFVVS